MKSVLPGLVGLCLAMCLAGTALAADSDPVDLPPAVQAFTQTGITIKKAMPAPDGYKGFVGQYEGRSIPVYLSPDGEHVLVGTLYDANGNNLTAATFRKASRPAYGEAEWQRLQNAMWIPEGAEDPERIVYVFTDTECPYCNRLWKMSKPMLADSNTQIRHVIVAVISPTKSAPRAAAVLGADDPAAAFQKHEANFGHSPLSANGEVPADIRKKLQGNVKLMRDLGVFGTPALLYKDAGGTVRVQSGVPRSKDTLKKILLGE